MPLLLTPPDHAPLLTCPHIFVFRHAHFHVFRAPLPALNVKCLSASRQPFHARPQSAKDVFRLNHSRRIAEANIHRQTLLIIASNKDTAMPPTPPYFALLHAIRRESY